MNPFASVCDDLLGLVAKLNRKPLMCGQDFARRVNFLLVACIVSGDLCGLRSAESAPFHRLPYLLAAWTGSVKIFLRVTLDLRSAASSWLDFIAEPCEAIGQFRLVDGGRKLLRVEEALRLNRPGLTVFTLCHVEDDGVRMELRSCVAVHRAGGVVLKFGRDELTRGLGGVVASDASLCVPL